MWRSTGGNSSSGLCGLLCRLECRLFCKLWCGLGFTILDDDVSCVLHVLDHSTKNPRVEFTGLLLSVIASRQIASALQYHAPNEPHE